jgi:hypothetical protein
LRESRRIGTIAPEGTIMRRLLLLCLLLPGLARAQDEEGEDAASPSGTSDPACLGRFEAGPPEALSLGGRPATVNGFHLTLSGPPDADRRAVIGVVASVDEASPENLHNLGRYLEFFRSRKVELIVAAGDVGERQEDIEKVLRKLAGAGIPILAYAGNLEHRPEFVAALQAVHRDLPHVISGHQVRRVDWDDVTLFTLPGHFDRRFLHRGRSCRWYREDLAALEKALEGAPRPVVLAAHSTPQGKAPGALDVVDGSHAGDPNLAELIATAKIPFGIFPNIKEAGARATADVAGARFLPPGKPSRTLYLGPGAADSAPWRMNDGSTLRGAAAVLSIDGEKASYAIFKAPRLTEEDLRKIAGEP